MQSVRLDHLTRPNFAVLRLRDQILDDLNRAPEIFYWWRPCTVRVLIVVDGLDFSPANGFGLSQFVTTLLDTGWYVRFAVTLADLRSVAVTSAGMMPGEGRITNRISGFRFDNPTHFAPDKYDVVFLFGIADTYQIGFPNRGEETLTNAELQAIGEFQNRGGGLFATGDHAALGKALCSKVARARNMRLWQSTNNQLGEDMVSMDGRYRNDTNRIGHNASTEFNDQSDDIPQTIEPVFYTRTSGIFRFRFPHPLLCGPTGVIRVMPDHPHEGECIIPSNPNLTLNFTGNLGPEYPPPTFAGARPLPEIISYNSVPPGNIARISFPNSPPDDKAPTVAQRFPGICAYDGHRARVGRVVTDATWHHFVNINLTGVPNLSPTDPKAFGFLASAAGQDAYEDIKAFYRNLAVWLSPAERISCMNSRLLWILVWHEHVLESVLTARSIGIEQVSARVLGLIGGHARDVLGRYAGRCESVRIILDLIEVNDPLIPWIDPWQPRFEDEPSLDDGELPLIDINPMLEAALGGALVSIATNFPGLNEKQLDKLKGEQVMETARKGAAVGYEKARQSLRASLERVTATFMNPRKRGKQSKD